MNDEEKKAVEFVKKRTKELKKYAKRENELCYDDIVLNLVSRLLKENEKLKYKVEGQECVIETQAHNEEVYERIFKRLEKENEELKILKDDIKDKRIVYVDTPEFEENYIQVAKIKEKIEKLKPYEDFFNGNDTNVGSI